MSNINRFSIKDLTQPPVPGVWDIAAILLMFIVIFALGWGARHMLGPFSLEVYEPISLDPIYLPVYAIKSVIRMFIAIFLSLIFTFIVGTAAAKSNRAEKIIIPLIDLFQSIPVIGFLSITVWGFIELFPGKMLGPECAAILALFTSQAWNIMLSFYQSLRTIPSNLEEAVVAMRLNAWQKFWRLEVPFAMPGLIWNTMLSLSAGWFFVVASEAISIANHTIKLPGIGSYIAVAIEQSDYHAINLAIITMFVVIIIYDQIILKPLIFWANKFNINNVDDIQSRPWIIVLFSKTWCWAYIGKAFKYFVNWWLRLGSNSVKKSNRQSHAKISIWPLVWSVVFLYVTYLSLPYINFDMLHEISMHDVFITIGYGLATTVRIFVCTIIATFIWVPVGVWIGLRPRLAATLQPIIQFLAAFPANLLFPVVVVFIIKNQLNVNIWTSPLIILGTQWYILFNVIAGIQAVPKSLYLAAKSLRLPKLVWWQKLILPGIFPQLITGIITAVGGAWNASILAEYVEWGNNKLIATGLGGYIATCYRVGDFAHLSLGIVVMSVFVLLINKFIWLPMCHLAQKNCQ